MVFTEDEFDIMVRELLYEETVRYDMLCHIAFKVLPRIVECLCASRDCLRGQGYEDDILQDAVIRLMNTTIDSFLLKEGSNGENLHNPHGFSGWIHKVTENIVNDYTKTVAKRQCRTVPLDILNPETIPAPEQDPGEAEERIQKLREAVDIVLSVDAGIYKVLTWLAQFVTILDRDITKIRSNEVLIAEFENKTLREMYDAVLQASRRIPWLSLSQEQKDRILAKLEKPWKAGIPYGDVAYRTFFMKSKGEASGKKSISDWVNRMNGRICQELGDDHQKKLMKTFPENGEDETRRDENGSPDS